MCVHVCVCVCECVCVCSMCVYWCMHVCVHTKYSMCVYWCMHVCVRMRVCACVRAYIVYGVRITIPWWTWILLQCVLLVVSCLTEFISGLLAMEQTCAKSNKWRLHSDLLKQFSCLVHRMTSDQIYSKFVLLLFRYVCSRVSMLVPAWEIC